MRKLRRIFESKPEIAFISLQQEFSMYWKSFLGSELGQIYQAIPWADLVKSLKLKDKRKGRRGITLYTYPCPKGPKLHTILTCLLIKSYWAMRISLLKTWVWLNENFISLKKFSNIEQWPTLLSFNKFIRAYDS